MDSGQTGIACAQHTLWRAGVPLHVAFESLLPHDRLLAALLSVPLGSVTLHDSLLMMHPEALSAVVSALATSARTLTSLRGLPLPAAAALWGPKRRGLRALTQLRALTLYHGGTAAASASDASAGQLAGADADASCSGGRDCAAAAVARRLRQPPAVAAHHAR